MNYLIIILKNINILFNESLEVIFSPGRSSLAAQIYIYDIDRMLMIVTRSSRLRRPSIQLNTKYYGNTCIHVGSVS